MTSPDMQGGSRVELLQTTPSIDLATLLRLLNAALPVAQGAGLAAQPLFAQHYVEGKADYLRINIAAVIQRLRQQTDFQTAFAPGSDSGLLRDAPLPPFGTNARMGGRILQGSEEDCSKQLAALQKAVEEELETALPTNYNFASLAQANMQQLMLKLAASLGFGKKTATAKNVSTPPESSANMVAVQFAEHLKASQKDDLARVLVGVESMDGGTWPEQFFNGVKQKLDADDADPDRNREIINLLREKSEQLGTQMQRFFRFLEEQAMGRVRMQVEMSIMEALASRAPNSELHDYVARVRELFELFAGDAGQALELEVSSGYGATNNVAFHDELRNSTFYYCLPVWCAASAQLLDQVAEDGGATRRAVSYRFRINGKNPEVDKPAFEARLERIEERLFPEPNTENDIQAPLVRSEIAQLVFLYLVIPPVTQRSDGETLLGQAQKIAEALDSDPQATLRRIYDALIKRKNVVQGIATEVVNLLKNKRDSLVSAANRTASKLYISVNRDIVNWNRLEGMSASSSGDVLATAQQGRDEIAWLGRIQVGNTPAAYNVLALFEVRTELEEHVITSAGEPYNWPLNRQLDAYPIPVRIAPHTWNAGDWQEAVAQPGLLAAGYGVQIEYDPAHLVAGKRMEVAHAEQLRAAQLVASAVLMYVALLTLVKRVKAATKQRQLTMLLLRLQQDRKSSQPDKDNSGSDTPMYALTQALERVLSRELPVKLQGLVAGRIGGKTASTWQKEGTLAALHGSQTLSFDQQGSLDKVALITYVTRPCDTHPKSDRNSYLFISRTYFASNKDRQTTVRVGRMWSRVVEGEELEVQHLILEEIKRLQQQGYTHVMLLSHHFGGRRIGRAAERHAPHASLEFLNHAAQLFPTVFIYPLHRDVFPATRLRKRQGAESAFEVRKHHAHGALYAGSMSAVLRSAEPIYTFATLHVIEEKQRPQSGFCTYFFTHESRLADAQGRETIRANILGTGAEGMEVRESLISVLRAIHFMESEKPFQGKRWLPVLDPFAWVNPTTMAALGELQVASGRRKGSIILSMPALLTQVCSMLPVTSSGGSTPCSI